MFFLAQRDNTDCVFTIKTATTTTLTNVQIKIRKRIFRAFAWAIKMIMLNISVNICKQHADFTSLISRHALETVLKLPTRTDETQK